MKPNAMALSGASVKSTNRLLDAAIEPEDLILLALADHRGSRCDPPRRTRSPSCGSGWRSTGPPWPAPWSPAAT